jgi:hypothetical protein
MKHYFKERIEANAWDAYSILGEAALQIKQLETQEHAKS